MKTEKTKTMKVVVTYSVFGKAVKELIYIKDCKNCYDAHTKARKLYADVQHTLIVDD